MLQAGSSCVLWNLQMKEASLIRLCGGGTDPQHWVSIMMVTVVAQSPALNPSPFFKPL